MSLSVIPLILSGGSGTRLWPLSRELRPKQLLPLVSERSLLQETLLRAEKLGAFLAPPIVVCNESHRFLVAEQLREIDAAPQTIVLEPAGRNTAPAVAVAAMLALERAVPDDMSPGLQQSASDGPLLLVLPADHVIADVEAFVQAVNVAVDAATAGCLVTFGIAPDRPETGYGYLLKGERAESDHGWFSLDQFVEKPDLATAEQYMNSGSYLWNSGMFLFSARSYLQELRRHAPKIEAECRRAIADAEKDRDFTRLSAAFLDCPSDSIDYAVMEKTDRAVVVPLNAGWSDIGSWPALHDMMAKDPNGNVLRGDVLAEGCRNSYISSSGRLVAAVGVQDYVIVETADAVLVMPHGAAQDIKLALSRLSAAGRVELKS